MKTLSLEQMEIVKGGWRPDGWVLSVEEHAICALAGFGAASCTFGAGAAFGYIACVGLIAAGRGEEVEWVDDTEVSEEEWVW
ncbi:MAG: hypothetical protein LBT25_02000 [Candidatus Symbiothrix sp.]|jgi:hypothetical protein|nr:hypothetical protein [Candidatus Symbiothrix sp.]